MKTLLKKFTVLFLFGITLNIAIASTNDISGTILSESNTDSGQLPPPPPPIQ